MKFEVQAKVLIVAALVDGIPYNAAAGQIGQSRYLQDIEEGPDSIGHDSGQQPSGDLFGAS